MYLKGGMILLGIGKTHGKIFLMGEHAVVYHQPGITIPLINLPTTVQVTTAQGSETYLNSQYYQGPLSHSPIELKGIKALIELLLQDLPISKPLQIQITSELPIERGMGSSAATGAAITKAMFNYAQVKLDYQQLLHYTDFSEKIIHGTPSGLDAITVNSQQPIYFIKDQLTQPFSFSLPAYLVIIDSGIKGQTGAAVHDLRLLKQQNPQQVTQQIQQLGTLTKQTYKLLKQPDVAGLGSLFQQAQTILQQLKISNSFLDELVDLANQAGALGTKITGGGRGGCLIALAANKTQAQKIAQAVKGSAHQVWIQALNNFDK